VQRKIVDVAAFSTAALAAVREFAGGKSNGVFSYRTVGRRKDVRRHTRFPKVNTRLSLPAAATRGAPRAARLRTHLARLEKQVRELSAKGGRSPALPKQPPLPLHVRAPRGETAVVRYFQERMPASLPAHSRSSF
jgi:hypothetical protein